MSPETFVLPTAGACGGYRLANERIDYMLCADGKSKYAELNRDGRVLKAYFGAEGTIILEEKAGETAFFRKDSNEESLENPLGRIFAGLKGMDFQKAEDVFRATIRSETEVTKPIPYTMYRLALNWKDGKYYEYQYFLYENGSVIVSASAPDEINPFFTKDTKWVHDLERQALRNLETDELVTVEIKDMKTDKGAPPEGGEIETVVSETTVEVTLNRDGSAGTVRYLLGSGEIKLEILNDCKPSKPAIPADAREMTAEEAVDALMWIAAAETLV